MQAISESSLDSQQIAVAVSITESSIEHLHEVQMGVFERVTHLRDRKIKLMEKLSVSVDARNLAQNQLLKTIVGQRIKQEKRANQSECRKAIMRHFELKREEEEMKQKLGQDELPNEAQNKMLQMIMKQRAQNKQMEDRIQLQRSASNQQQLLQIKISIKQLQQQIIKQRQQMARKQESGDGGLKELFEYIEEEQNSKRMLYEDLVDFQKEMEELRTENQMLSLQNP